MTYKENKITIKKVQDITGNYWLILNEEGNEIFSYCRETALTNKAKRSGGYTYQEVIEHIKKVHPEWELV